MEDKLNNCEQTSDVSIKHSGAMKYPCDVFSRSKMESRSIQLLGTLNIGRNLPSRVAVIYHWSNFSRAWEIKS